MKQIGFTLDDLLQKYQFLGRQVHGMKILLGGLDSRTAKEVFAGYQGGQMHLLFAVDLFE